MEKKQYVKYKFVLLDSLEKVMPNKEPSVLENSEKHLYGFKNEKLSFQLAYTMEYDGCEIPLQEVELKFRTQISEAVQIRKVELVPSRLPVYQEQLDEDYLYQEACLCPDLLLPVNNSIIRPVPYQWRSVWFTVDLDHVEGSGDFPIEIQITQNKELFWQDKMYIHVAKEELPKQTLIHTEWFHADCLANYYQVPVFSEAHWEIIGNFVDSAVKHGMNMLLTPVFTPPLDTKEGGERTTVQLVKVRKDQESYTFEFDLLDRWIDLCMQKGMEYIEISHLFTQWGAKHAPKVMAWEQGEEKQIFGWDTLATGREYQQFLQQFLPELKTFLRKKGILEKTYFHISDEPHDKEKETYAAAKESVRELLKDCKVMDALSSYDLYKEGIVENPIVCNDCIQPFIDEEVKDLWTYYCCVQGKKVSNRFMAMPLERIRILGIQLYLYDIKGFLHWGFNFYNSQYSLSSINPYLVTDADGGFPSGDPFVVYPAPDRTAYDSIRLEVFAEALYDLRALQKLEKKVGRKQVVSLIQEGYSPKITFCEYPKEESYIRRLRKRLYEELNE